MLALGLVASSASSVHASTLRLARGDQVVYYVVVPGNGLEMVVAMVVGEDAPCTDGFDRSFTCAAVSLTYSSPGVAEQTIPVMLSRQHAEALSSGDASASARQFARPSWLWLGYPGFRATTDGDRQLREGIRVALVGGLDIPLRLALGAQIETMLSGSRLAVAFGDPTVEVRQLDGEQVRYVLTPDAGQLFPLAFQVESADGTLLASATRTGVARGSRAISFAGWTPLDFPAQRLGLTFVPWDRLPPSDGSAALYYPLGEAERFAALSPTMALRNGQHPDWYQLLALLIERADSLTGDAATSLRTASWVFWNGSAALQSSWDGGAERRAPMPVPTSMWTLCRCFRRSRASRPTSWLRRCRRVPPFPTSCSRRTTPLSSRGRVPRSDRRASSTAGSFSRCRGSPALRTASSTPSSAGPGSPGCGPRRGSGSPRSMARS